VVDEERIRLQATDWDQSFVFCFSSLTLLAGCQEGHPDRGKSVPLIPKRSLPEEVEEENQEVTG